MWSILYYVRRNIHQSYLFMWLGFSVVVGIALSRNGAVYNGWLCGALAAILLCVAFYKRSVWVVLLVVCAGVLFGCMRGGVVTDEYDKYREYIGARVVLFGTVSEDVKKSKAGDIRLVLRDITIQNRKLPGDIWVSVHADYPLERNDVIVVEGVMSDGFGAFAASMEYATINEHKPRKDIVRDVRDWFADKVRQAVDEPMASLGLGFLVGQRSKLPEELDEQLRIAGLTHIVVASGYNVTILLRFAKRFFEKISKYLVALSGGSLLLLFLSVTGFTPSMVRAAIVGGLSLAVWYYGRSFYPFVLISIVMAVTALWNPVYVWGDAGWYLSFAAFFGVMVLAPLLQQYFYGEEKPRFLRQIVGETTAALLMTIPITILLFQQYSVYAFIANVLVVPFVPFAMLAVFGAGMIESVLPGLAITGFAADFIIGAMVGIVQWVSSLPHASAELEISVWVIVVYYTSVTLAMLYMAFKTKYNFRDSNIIE